ncbi:hypothetical protein JXB41_02435 [Candidatus Woesearchaeota archaeon]|nr:hypothetical protein [Candidatus Woesearchaeota archaeon]
MKKIIVLVLILFVIGCKQSLIGNNLIKEKPLEVNIIDLNADKELYHSNELMKINVLIESNQDINGVNLKVYGIYSKNSYRLSYSEKINLTKGNENLVEVHYTTPRCNTCSGISEGIYDIMAELDFNEEKLAEKTISVEIRQ